MTSLDSSNSNPGNGSTISHEADIDLRDGGVPCLILDLTDNHLIAANDAFASLVNLDATVVQEFDLLSFLPAQPRALLEAVLSGVQAGLIHFCQGQAHVGLPDGGEQPVWGWVRSLPGQRALIAFVPTGPAEDPGEGPGDTGPPVSLSHTLMALPDTYRLVLGALDHEWRLSEISPDAGVWLGWNRDDYRGTRLQSLVHPGDAPALLLALGRSGVERRGVATLVRVRTHDGEWVHVRCELTPLCDHNPPRFALALWVLDAEHNAESGDQRAARLEDHLWRIALEIAAAGIGDSPGTAEMWWGDPALRELSQRQLDILRRLLRGERVPTIASDLFLSQSTVRNHLSAIYRRLGVHSQAELLARLLPSRPPPPPGED